MKLNFKLTTLSTVLGAAALMAAGAAQAQAVKIMTGPQGGSWYPLGGAMAKIVEDDGIAMQILPGAGIANVKALQQNKADIGLGNNVTKVVVVSDYLQFYTH